MTFYMKTCSFLHAYFTETMKIVGYLASLDVILSNKRITKALIRLHGCAGWSAPLLFLNPRRRFSRVDAHIRGSGWGSLVFTIHYFLDFTLYPSFIMSAKVQ